MKPYTGLPSFSFPGVLNAKFPLEIVSQMRGPESVGLILMNMRSPIRVPVKVKYAWIRCRSCHILELAIDFSHNGEQTEICVWAWVRVMEVDLFVAILASNGALMGTLRFRKVCNTWLIMILGDTSPELTLGQKRTYNNPYYRGVNFIGFRLQWGDSLRQIEWWSILSLTTNDG